MKILLCEHEDILLSAIEFRLRKRRYEVEIARDGKEALRKISTYQPDLLIISLELPVKSGLDLVQELRETQNDDTPILLIAPLEEEELIIKGLLLGANDFITKPFKPVELVLRVRHLLPLKALNH